MLVDKDPIIFAEGFCEMEGHSCQDVAEHALESQTQYHCQNGRCGKKRRDIDPENAVQDHEQDAQIKYSQDQAMKDLGKREFPVSLHMPAEENSIHQPDKKKDEKEYEGRIKIGMELLRGKEGVSDNADFQNESDDQKNKGDI